MKTTIIFIAMIFATADGLRCYKCSGERDHIEYKDETSRNCWEKPENSLPQFTCKAGEDFCITSVMVDFRFDGMLISSIDRRCASALSIGSRECKESDDSDEIGFETKDCKAVCEEDGCNDSRLNNEVLSQYSTGTVKSCRTCSETKIGAYNDLECENEETIDCPAYADTSCFTAAYTREFDGTYSHQLNKGCSSFKSNFEDDPTCYEINHNQINGNVETYREETCKESCRKDNCNNVITKRPCLDFQICPEIETTTEYVTTEELTTPGETTTEQVLSTTEFVATIETPISTTASPETPTQTSTTTLSTSKPTTTAETTISTTSTSTITTTISTTTTTSKRTSSTQSSSTSASTTTASSMTSTTSSSTSSPPTSSTSSLSTSTTTSQSTEKDDSDSGCDHTCIIIISTVVPTTCVIVGLCVYLFIFRDRKDIYEEEFSESPGRKTCSTEVKDTQF